MTTGTYDTSPWHGGAGGNGGIWPVRPMWIAATVLAFIVWWPLGLILLGFLFGSGRMGCRGRGFRMGSGWAPGSAPWAGWRSFCGGEHAAPTSGNRAFDEYRSETLRRLEEEQKEFSSFLERLRFAKDKSEFDAFMAERRQRPEQGTEPSQEQPRG